MPLKQRIKRPGLRSRASDDEASRDFFLD